MARVALGLLVVALVGALVAPAAADEVPSGYTYEHAWFTSTDGTQLHAGVFLPADRKANERHPVLLVSTPYTAPNGGVTGATESGINREGPTIRFPELFDHAGWMKGRWAYVQVDVRGFGGSGGCFNYYMPTEAEDVKVAVEWAAEQPWSTGRVGMWGKSYDAAQQVLALGKEPRGLAASVIQAPGLSAYTALWMNGVHYATGRYATTSTYTADDLAPPQNESTATSPEYALAAASAATAPPTCRTDAIVGMNTERDRKSAFWRGREAYLKAAGSKVPVFWSHGFFDANTKPVHLPIWTSLRGPKQAWFGQYTHLRGHEPGVGRKGFLDEAIRWLDRYVRGVKVPATDPAVTVQQGNLPGRWRAEEQWPPADARSWSFPVRPGSYTDEPGNTGDGANAGQGHWSITKPLPYDAHLAGEPELRVRIQSSLQNVHVVAHLYDIDANGSATLVTRGAMAAPKTGEQGVAYLLYPQDWVFEKGHRIAIHLSGSDDEWFSPGTSMTTVEVLGGSISLPLLTYVRDEFLSGAASDGMATITPFPVGEETLREATVKHRPPPRQKQR
ncbi:MAG TPA: CocE/NonD family hydrolase [Actinomycetota bacterium]|nr:CocE/NonD family hydrolase [Actinomycetota bacterium]